MNLEQDLSAAQALFLDTAPIIYYIESHTEFGPLAKTVVDAIQRGQVIGYSSVITLAEVLPKPIEKGNVALSQRFADFLRYGKSVHLVDIIASIAEEAGRLRGSYTFLKTMDAIQVAAALEVGADVFVTNDKKLKNISHIKILVLSDYL